MTEQIKELIAEGRTEDALALLVKHNSDAVLLQARYNQAKKQQNMGMIDFGEWSRVQAQVNYAALEMASNIKNSTSSQSQPQTGMQYLNFSFDPNAPTIMVGKIIRALELMYADSVVIESEVKQAVSFLSKIFSADALPPVVVTVQKGAFADLDHPSKLRTLTAALETILDMKEDLKAAAVEVGQIDSGKVATRDNVALLLRNLELEVKLSNWTDLRDMVNEYFAKPMFEKSALTGWKKLAKQVDELPTGLLWKSKFSKTLLTDVQAYIRANNE